jgi:dTDP-4-amino-4,6-dideoxygalactose transaminase
MHGQMVDMPRLIKWANLKKIKVIEDCAQAHGAEIHGKKAGSWGDFGAFSFYPTKLTLFLKKQGFHQAFSKFKIFI